MGDRFRTVLDAIQGFVWDWNLETGELVRHGPDVPLFGYSPCEVVGGTEWWLERTHPEDRHRWQALFDRACGYGKAALECRYRFRRKDGSYAPVIDRIRIKYRKGKAVRAVGCVTDLTAQEATIAALATSERRFRALATTATAGIWRLTPEGEFIEKSPELCERLGLDISTFSARDVPGLIHPDDIERVYRTWEECRVSGRVFEMEHRFKMPDGTFRWFLNRAVPVRDEEGRIGEWIGSHHDIHGRKLIEEWLRLSEERFRQLSEAIPMPVVIGRLDGYFEYCNPAYCNWSGYTLEEKNRIRAQLGNMSELVDLLVAEGIETLTAAMQRMAETGEAVQADYRVRCKDGSLKWTSTKFIPLEAGPDGVGRYVASLTDVEDQRRVELRLRQQAEVASRQQGWLEFVMDAIPTPMLLVAGNGSEVVFANRAAREVIDGLTGDPSMTREAMMRIRALDTRGIELVDGNRPFLRAIREGVFEEQEVTFVGSRGRMTALVHGLMIPAIFGRSETLLMVYQPIDRLKQAERELREANEAKDRFMAVLSHELRTPLTPVLTLSQMMEKDRSLPAEARESLGIIRRNIELETRLIDDLLDLTRITRGKLKLDLSPVDLRDSLGSVISICHADLRGKAITLVSDLGPEKLTVTGDAARLQQVFWNLVKNAIQFTPNDGRIELSGSVDHESRWVTVRLKDSGIGIPAHLLPRVFDAFMQGDHDPRHHGGLGLGLAIAKALVGLHGGTLTASSPGPGKGAEFVARFPLAPEPVPPPVTASGDSPARKALRILLVEDHHDTARVMTRLLTHLGHSARVVGSVSAALAMLRAERFDLVLSDIGLPDGSGYDLMRQSAGFRPAAIAISGFGMDEDVQRSRDAGFSDHLTKPVDANILEAAILRAAEQTPEDASR